MDGERAGVHVADRVDQADHPASAAQVQPGQRRAVAAQVEERVPGEHAAAVRHQPVVQLPLLARGQVQLVPHVGAAAGRAQPGEPELRAEPVGQRLQLVELADVVPGHHDGDLEAGEPRVGQLLHGPQRDRVRPGPAHRVVHLGGGAVQGDLHVHVVAAGQPPGDARSDLDAVGGELDPDVVPGGVVEQVPEVRPDGRLTAADVDVEHLHPLQLVDDRLAFRGAQLPRVTPPRAGQAVHAGQVARVGQLPGQADRRGQPVAELLDQRQRARADRGRGHAASRRQIICAAASVASARR